MKDLLKRLLLSLLALLLLFEEWLWDVLTALGYRLSCWLQLEAWENWLRQSSPFIAATAFLIPLTIVTPLNLIAFWMMASGKLIQGIILEIFAKLLGTVLIARVFALTRPQLMSFRWFNWLYSTISGWLKWAHDRVQATTIYKAGKKLKSEVRLAVRRLLGRPE